MSLCRAVSFFTLAFPPVSALRAPLAAAVPLLGVNFRSYSSAESHSGFGAPSRILLDEIAKVHKHPSFESKRVEPVDEYGLMAVLLRHQKTGATVLSLLSDGDNLLGSVDAEKEMLFAACFRTPTEESTGIPHILEHSVLCGSRKYSIREPFAQLMKGSLNSFLNAMTFPDRTCYPVASTNEKDFENLMDVYLDAVLFPNAVKDPSILAQEGWHFTLEHAKDPLSINGVVMNEMRGVYSNPDGVMQQTIQQTLFPNTTYRYDSGGNPDLIPNLTFDNFREFYHKHYGPSNAKFFLYGPTASADRRLATLAKFLDEIDETSSYLIDTTIKAQPAFTDPRLEVKKYQPTGSPPTDMATVNWALPPIYDIPKCDVFGLAVLDDLLLGSSAGPLYKALAFSGLGKQTITWGLSDELLHPTFSVGLKGLEPHRGGPSSVERIVMDTLQDLSTREFESKEIEASLNSVEFQLSEVEPGRYPRALAFVFSSMSKWNYDMDPIEALKFKDAFDELKLRIRDDSRYLNKLLKLYLVENQHRNLVVLQADINFHDDEVNQDVAKLAQFKDSLSDEAIQSLVNETRALVTLQSTPESPEALASIPLISLKDVDRHGLEIPTEISSLDFHGTDVTVLLHELPSAKIVHVNILLPLDHLEFDELRFLPLLCRLLLESGTPEISPEDWILHLKANTGGFQISPEFTGDSKPGRIGNPEIAKGWLHISAKILPEKSDAFTSILRMLFRESAIDVQSRAIEILDNMLTAKENSVLEDGHKFAMRRIVSKLEVFGLAAEATEGVDFITELRHLTSVARTQWQELLSRLERIKSKVFGPLAMRRMLIDLTGNGLSLDMATSSLRKLPNELVSMKGAVLTEDELEEPLWVSEARMQLFPEGGHKGQQVFHQTPNSEVCIAPTLVNYICQGARISEPGDKMSEAMGVVARSLSTGYLWNEVRVRSGAYGVGCKLDSSTGIMLFYSYRDPNVDSTLRAYKEAASHISSMARTISERELTQVIIGRISDLDKPISAGTMGKLAMMQYINGESKEDRQKMRDQVLGTSAKDFEVVASLMEQFFEGDKSLISAVASETAIQQAQEVRFSQVKHVFEDRATMD